MKVEFKGEHQNRTRSTICVLCLNPIAVGETCWNTTIRDPVFDDQFVVLPLSDDKLPVVVEQVGCRTCRGAKRVSEDWVHRAIMVKVQTPRCEALLSQGRRCRQTTYVKYDETESQDRCPKHRTV